MPTVAGEVHLYQRGWYADASVIQLCDERSRKLCDERPSKIDIVRGLKLFISCVEDEVGVGSG